MIINILNSYKFTIGMAEKKTVIVTRQLSLLSTVTIHHRTVNSTISEGANNPDRRMKTMVVFIVIYLLRVSLRRLQSVRVSFVLVDLTLSLEDGDALTLCMLFCQMYRGHLQ